MVELTLEGIVAQYSQIVADLSRRLVLASAERDALSERLALLLAEGEGETVE